MNIIIRWLLISFYFLFKIRSVKFPQTFTTFSLVLDWYKARVSAIPRAGAWPFASGLLIDAAHERTPIIRYCCIYFTEVRFYGDLNFLSNWVHSMENLSSDLYTLSYYNSSIIYIVPIAFDIKVNVYWRNY